MYWLCPIYFCQWKAHRIHTDIHWKAATHSLLADPAGGHGVYHFSILILHSLKPILYFLPLPLLKHLHPCTHSLMAHNPWQYIYKIVFHSIYHIIRVFTIHSCFGFLLFFLFFFFYQYLLALLPSQSTNLYALSLLLAGCNIACHKKQKNRKQIQKKLVWKPHTFSRLREFTKSDFCALIYLFIIIIIVYLFAICKSDRRDTNNKHTYTSRSTVPLECLSE